jgi:hypothetical protein
MIPKQPRLHIQIMVIGDPTLSLTEFEAQFMCTIDVYRKIWSEIKEEISSHPDARETLFSMFYSSEELAYTYGQKSLEDIDIDDYRYCGTLRYVRYGDIDAIAASTEWKYGAHSLVTEEIVSIVEDKAI